MEERMEKLGLVGKIAGWLVGWLVGWEPWLVGWISWVCLVGVVFFFCSLAWVGWMKEWNKYE